MTDCIVIITTTDTVELARNIAKRLVQSSLSKCVQFSKINSVYEWDGKVEEVEEYRVLIKASKKNVKAIEEVIIALHSYSLPQFISINVDNGSKPYLDWIEGL